MKDEEIRQGFTPETRQQTLIKCAKRLEVRNQKMAVTGH